MFYNAFLFSTPAESLVIIKCCYDFFSDSETCFPVMGYGNFNHCSHPAQVCIDQRLLPSDSGGLYKTLSVSMLLYLSTILYHHHSCHQLVSFYGVFVDIPMIEWLEARAAVVFLPEIIPKQGLRCTGSIWGKPSLLLPIL